MRSLLLALVALGACRSEAPPPPPPAPTVALVLPLAEGGARAREVVEGVERALDGRYALLPVEDAGAPTVASLAARPEVVGALAHLSTAAADAAAPAWAAADLPVLALAPASDDALPRLVPSPDELGRCAVALVEGRRVAVVHDGSATAMRVAGQIQEGLGARAWTMLGLDPADLGTDLGRLGAAGLDGIVYTGAATLGGDLLRALRAQGQRTPLLAVGGSADELLRAAGPDAGAVILVAPDRAPFHAEALRRYAEASGHAPTGAARSAHDAATVLAAALDLVPRGPDGLPPRAEVRAALGQVIGVGLGGPLALAEGRPTPIQCTAYGRRDAALEVVGAAQVGTNGQPVPLTVYDPR